MYRKIFRELFYYIIAGLVMWYSFILISDGINIRNGIIAATQRCLNVIIPSLFAFMAVSGIIIESGLYSKISLPFYPLSKYILKIPPGLFFVFLLGNLAGYPIGIKLLGSMVQKGQISKRTAEIMSCCCFCGGPAFYAGAVGLTVFGSTAAGMIIFLSIVISNLITGMIINRVFKIEEKDRSVNINFSPQIFTDSILSAGKSLFVICTLIIFFSTFMSLADHYSLFQRLQEFGISQNGTILLKSILEITSVSELDGQPFDLLPLIAGICSLGGVCVIIQVIALNKNIFSLKKFLLTRPVCAALSIILCFILSKFMLPTAISAAAQTKKIFVKTDNLIPSICLILMILLLGIKKRLAFSKKI